MVGRNRTFGLLGAGSRLGVWILFGVLLLAAVPMAYSLTGSAPRAGAAPSASPARAAVPASGFPTGVQHVITIFEENNATQNVLKAGPFEKYLWDTYANGGWTYYAVCHPSAPNYMSVTQGQPRQCGSDSYNNYSGTANIGSLVDTAGLSWRAYEETMPSPCYTSDSGLYLVRHNPLSFYQAADCKTNDLPFPDWNPNSSSQANYIWVTPNADNDAHNKAGGGVIGADAWLRVFFEGGTDINHSGQLQGWPGIMNEPWWSSTVVFITYDEGADYNTSAGYTVPGVSPSYCSGGKSVCGGQVYFVAVSPYTLGMGAYGGNASHYNLLNTTEWLLGLHHSPGGYDGNPGFPAMESLFNVSSKGTTTYSVTGTVAKASGGAVSGATVYANSSSASRSTTTSTTGNFSFSLANGSYQLTATASGYEPESRTVAVAGAALSGEDFSLTAVPVSPEMYWVNGTVQNVTDSMPVGAATVFANNSTTHLVLTTGSNGSYEFLLANGSYRINATAAGYEPLSVNLTVNGTSVVGFDLDLVPVGEVAYPNDGVVRSDTGTPIANATLYFTRGAVTTTVVTNSSGGFAVDLTNGSYNVTVVASGYASYTSTVSVKGPNSFSFTLSSMQTTSAARPAGSSFLSLSALEWGVMLGVFAAVGLTGWGLGRWVRRSPRRGPPP